MHCLGCCARLVLSTRPGKDQAEGMFAAIARYPYAPSRSKIVEAMRLAIEAERAAAQPPS